MEPGPSSASLRGLMGERGTVLGEQIGRARAEAAAAAEALERVEREMGGEAELDEARVEETSATERENLPPAGQEAQQQLLPERLPEREADTRIRPPLRPRNQEERQRRWSPRGPADWMPPRHPGFATSPRRYLQREYRQEEMRYRTLPTHPAERDWPGTRVREPAEGLFPQMDLPEDIAPPAPRLTGARPRRRPVFRTRLDPTLYEEEARERILALREHADEWYQLAKEEAGRGRANGARHRQAVENGRMNEERAEELEDQQEEIIRRRGERVPRSEGTSHFPDGSSKRVQAHAAGGPTGGRQDAAGANKSRNQGEAVARGESSGRTDRRTGRKISPIRGPGDIQHPVESEVRVRHGSTSASGSHAEAASSRGSSGGERRSILHPPPGPPQRSYKARFPF